MSTLSGGRQNLPNKTGARLAMGLFSRGLMILAFVLSFHRSTALADDTLSPAHLPVINGKESSSEWQALPYDHILQRCTSVDCTALKSIVRSFDYFYKLYLPGTIERTHPQPSPPTGPAPLVHDVALRPELREPSCKLLTVLSRNYFDWSVGLVTVELASLISRGHRQCLKDVVLAFPRSEETRRLVENAQELCVVRARAELFGNFV